MVIFTGMVLFYMAKSHGRFMVSPNVIFLPLLFVLLIVAALGTAYLLSAVTVMFRDLRFIIPFITQLGIWLTAVVYPQTIFTTPARDANGKELVDALGHTILLHDYRDWLALNPFRRQSYRASAGPSAASHCRCCNCAARSS